MTTLSRRRVPVAPKVPVDVPRIRNAKPAALFAAALKAVERQQVHAAAVPVVTDGGVPSAAKTPAAPAVDISVAQTFGPVAL